MIEPDPISSAERQQGVPALNIPGLSEEIRAVLVRAIELPEGASEVTRRAMENNLERQRRLRERIEAGEITEILDGEWVIGRYESNRVEYQQCARDVLSLQGEDHVPASVYVIRKCHVNTNQALVLTAEAIDQMGTFTYIDTHGGEVDVEPEHIPPGMVCVVFPEELGD